jgi:D-arabinose 1-dehydrogenase-like Zn-dependent alcohol dehydrogenase
MPTAIAAVLAGQHEPFLLREVETEHPRPGEVLIRTVATGLCHTDLNAREGRIPFPLSGVPGHEGAGIIEEVGEGISHDPGRRVTKGPPAAIGNPSAGLTAALPLGITSSQRALCPDSRENRG